MSEPLSPPEHDWPPNGGGVVEFQVWEASPDGRLRLIVIGPHLWRRPITATRDGELIVKVDSRFNVSTLTVSDYLKAVFGDLAEFVAEHSVSYPVRGLDGPIGEAPTIRRPIGE